MGSDKIGKIAGNLVVALGAVVLLCGTVAHGQTAAKIGGWPKGKKIIYPTEGQVTADKVQVRAGGGFAYYVSGEMTRNSKVVVHAEKGGWLKIDAPKGCFSLIAAKYVKKSGGGRGVVTGNRVRVRAEASKSTQIYTEQCKLNKGDKVRIFGGALMSKVDGEAMRFYKIEPPAGKAFFWISSKYVRHVKGYRGEPVVKPEDIVKIPTTPDIEHVLKIPEPPVVPKSTDRTELENLDEAPRIEMRRPLAQRRLAEHLAKYLALSTKTKSKSIAELSRGRVKKIRQHIEIQADMVRAEIIKKSFNKSHEHMMALLENLDEKTNRMKEGKVRETTGQLKASNVFRSRGMKRWLLVDPFTGRNICYLLPGVVKAEVLKSKEGKIVTISGPAVFEQRRQLDLVVVNKMRSDDS